MKDCFGDYACGAEECEFCEYQEECMEESYPPGSMDENQMLRRLTLFSKNGSRRC